MENIKIENLTFTYPLNSAPSLKNVSLNVNKGEFVTIFGKSGCGKSTLLRHIKPPLCPHGERTGEVYLGERSVFSLSNREQAEKIGFVMQNPDEQIVTDKVWHELAFGLENLGIANDEIRARVAETSAFFGISDWFYKNTDTLSGGQKQLLNLAAVMVMQPSVLILDEPTSRLDPISAKKFLQAVSDLNKELGTTVILTEHRLDEALAMSDVCFAMEDGEITAHGEPRKVCAKLKELKSDLTLSLPVPARIFSSVGYDGNLPLTVREGRKILNESKILNKLDFAKNPPCDKKCALELKNLYFRYEKDSPDILKGLSAKIFEGEHYAILGANGAGKSTLLNVISGGFTPYSGKINVLDGKKIAYLPQEVKMLFAKNTVADDLREAVQKDSENFEKRLENIIEICGLENLTDRHPYDLSGGEQQRTAMAKVLLTEPDILLLDEPTKGIDAHFKQKLARLIKTLQKSGITVVTVSHDIEFCAEFADRCAMFFDGQIVSEGAPREFFDGKNFYTTAANRMSRQIIDNAVLERDVIFALGGKITETEDESVSNILLKSTERKAEKAENPSEKHISPKRIALGIIFALLFVLQSRFSVYPTAVLTKIFGSFGESMAQIFSIMTLAVSLICFIPQKKIGIGTKKSSGKLDKRTILASVFVLITVPLTVLYGVYFLGDRKFYFISLAVIFETLIPFFAVFEGRKPKARELVVISVLCALAVAGRTAFFMLPQFKPIVAVVMISSVCFGAETGFLVGAVSAFVSNFYFSQGPWTPWQMLALGAVGFVTGIVYQKNIFPKTKLSLAVFGFFATLIIYGGIMNPASVITYQPYPDFALIVSSYWLGLPFDLVHAFSTAFFMWFISEPLIDKLERIKVKYGLVKDE